MSKEHSKFFPGKLRIMLDRVDELDLNHGSSWVSEGCAFAIHDPDVFMKEIAPKFFDRQTHLRSFHRQLSIWGFGRIETSAKGRGVWFHKNFIRDKPGLMKYIKRVPVKNPKLTAPKPKSRLSDYSSYHLPSPFRLAYPDTANSSSMLVAKPTPTVHRPHQNIAAVVANDHGGLPESRILPGGILMPPRQETLGYGSTLGRVPPRRDTLDYLSRLGLGQIPPAVHPPFSITHNNALPVPINSAHPATFAQALKYQSLLLSDCRPLEVTSMNHFPAVTAGNPYVPSTNNDLSEAAQNLIACRQNFPSQNANNNLNAEILAMIMDPRRQGTDTSNSGLGLRGQDLLSDITRSTLFQQGPSSS